MTMSLIETKTLATSAASIEFTSIPQDGTDLVAFFSFRTTSGAEANVYLTLNGSTTSFTNRNLYGDGTSMATNTTARYIGVATGGSQTANTFTNGLLTIPNYAGSTNKSFFADDGQEANQTQAYRGVTAGLWSNTSAITSIAFTGATWAIGSIVSLYKVTKGTDGIVVVS